MMRKTKGHTLLELIVGLVIVVLIATIAYKSMQPGDSRRQATKVVDEFFYLKNRIIEHYHDSTGYDTPVAISTYYAMSAHLTPPETANESGVCTLPSGHECIVGLLRGHTSPDYLTPRDGFSLVIRRVDFEMCHVIIPQLANHFKYVAHGSGIFKSPDVNYTDAAAMSLCDSLSANGGFGRILVSHY